MQIAYLDCFSGISGDMLLGAFIDAGVPDTHICNTLGLVDITGFHLEVSRKNDSGLRATRALVRVEEERPLRRLGDIERLLASGSLPETVHNSSIAIFHRLAEAEAAVHGCQPEEVHFHEIGAVDTLVDIVGTVACMDHLGIRKLICSPLPLARGWITCAHGDLPLPGPAVGKLLQDAPVYGVNIDQELITPTGAAIVMELADSFGPIPAMRLQKCSYGAGEKQRDDGRPNLLRLILGKEYHPDEAQLVTVIETSLDDWSPEIWPHVLERLLAGGALDVILIPVHMKKGRPGFLLKVICEAAHVSNLQKIIFSETGTIGLRFHTEQRLTLAREIVTVETPWGPVQAKKIESETGFVLTPEYEECRRLAQDNNITITSVYQAVSRAADK